MANLGDEVGRSTIANILREYGVDPAPERDKHMPWSTFLRAHRECLVATDFLTVEVCTIRALVTHYVLFFIDIVNRAMKIAGRNHQGLENRIPQPMSVTALPHHPVQRRQRLGGMLSYYHRAAA